MNEVAIGTDIIVVRISMGLLLVGILLLAGWSLWKVNKNETLPNLIDLLTSTDKAGKVRFDARKCWEAGAFAVSTWGFVYVTLSGHLTEWYFGGYMGAWVLARTLRDREQRLSNGHHEPAKPAAQPS